jgi:hypothetical protein
MAFLGDTDIMRLVREIAAGASTPAHLVATLAERASSVNLAGAGGNTALHIAAAAPLTDAYDRTATVTALIAAGANPFLCNDAGLVPVELTAAGVDRESFVAVLLKYRVDTEKQIPSVAPLFASRLMKRVDADRGFAAFSQVIPHALYYLFRGAVYMWDTLKDVEHVIYDPRATRPGIGSAAAALNVHMRKKSFVARGGADATFDFADEEVLNGRIKELEAGVAFVSNFVVSVGLKARKGDVDGAEGCFEWILCDEGTLVAVHLDKADVIVRRGRAASGAGERRKSHVCGANAEYPLGMEADVQRNKSCIRFRPHEATNVCCAVDSIGGSLTYILAKHEPEAAPPAGTPPPPQHGQSPPAPQSLGGSASTPKSGSRGGSPKNRGAGLRDIGFISSPFADISHGMVKSMDIGSNTTAEEQLDEDQIELTADWPTVRVLLFEDMTPKVGFDECMQDLCHRHVPFAGATVADLPLGADDDPFSVQYVTRTAAVVFCATGMQIVDLSASPAVFAARPPAPATAVTTGMAMNPNRFSLVQAPLPHTIIQQSRTVDLYDFNPKTLAVTLTMRIAPDRVAPHRFTPLFHPVSNLVVLFFRSLQRQELCTFNLTSRRMRSVCRLPKPSSLRFTPAAQAKGAAAVPKIPEMCFATSKDGQYVLRYNASMQVMTIYKFADIMSESAHVDVTSCFTREPAAISQFAQNREVAVAEAEAPARLFMAAEWADAPLGDAALVADACATISKVLALVTLAHGGAVAKAAKGGADGAPVWSSSFDVALEMVRCAVAALRALVAAPWSAAVLAHPSCAAVALPHQKRNTEQFQQYDGDVNAAAHLWRGPRVLLSLHSEASDRAVRRSQQHVALQIGGQRGVIAVAAPLVKVLAPLKELFAAQPLVEVLAANVTIMVPKELHDRLLVSQ